jgi:glycosyltransferase involved in cell wall biosynthesis
MDQESFKSLSERLSFFLNHFCALNDVVMTSKRDFISHYQTLLDAPLSFEKKRTASFLIFLCRYPDKKEYGFFRSLNNAQELYDYFLSLKEFQDLITSSLTFRLTLSSKDTLYLDVSETLFYAHNSGIQKVIRSFFVELSKNPQSKLALFFGTMNLRPIELKDSYSYLMKDWSLLSVLSQRSFVFKFFRLLNKSLKKAVYLSLLTLSKFLPPNKMKRLENLIDTLKSGFLSFCDLFPFFVRPFKQASLLEPWPLIKKIFYKKQKPYEFDLLYFENSHMLVMELAKDPNRIEFYESFKSEPTNKLTVVIHDLIPVFCPHYVSRFLYPQLLIFFSRILKITDQISTVSHFSKERIEDFLACLARNEVLPPPTLKVHTLGVSRLREKVEPQGLPLLLSIGTLESRKNQTTFLKACEILFETIKNFKVVLAGGKGLGHEEIISYYEKLKQKGMPIEVQEGLKDEQVEALYQASYFSVFCSHYEGFGLPILESLSYAKPVITSFHGSMKEIGEKGGCWLVDPNDPMMIAKAMETLLSSKETYHRMSNEALKNSYLRTWDVYSKEVYDFSLFRG